MHENFCSTYNAVCDICKETFSKEDLQEHLIEHEAEAKKIAEERKLSEEINRKNSKSGNTQANDSKSFTNCNKLI